MKKLFRLLSGFLFLLALIALGFLGLSDLWLRFQATIGQQRAGALALIFVGASFICLQLSADLRRKEMGKGILLGLAFILWGGEQFLPPGAAVTAIDCAVITIFVVDLGLVIKGGLGRKPSERSGENLTKVDLDL